MKKAHIISYYMLGLVILVLTLVVFSSFLLNFKDAYSEVAYDSACNQWIKLNMFSQSTFVNADLGDAPCKTKEETISVSSKFNLMKEVSDRQVICANTFGRGEKNLFNVENDQEKMFCAACYHLSFDSSPSLTVDSQELLLFQSLNANSKEKYLDILSTKDMANRYLENRERFERQASISEEIVIDTNKEYLVVFQFDKKGAKDIEQKVLENAALAGGITLGIVVIGVVAAPFTLGTSLAVAGAALAAAPIIAGGAAVAGGYLTYAHYHSAPNGDSWLAAHKLVEFNPENMNALACDHILGVQEPGITGE